MFEEETTPAVEAEVVTETPEETPATPAEETPAA